MGADTGLAARPLGWINKRAGKEDPIRANPLFRPHLTFVIPHPVAWQEPAVVLLLALCLALLPLTVSFMSTLVAAAALLLLRRPWLIWPALAVLLSLGGARKFGPLNGVDLLLLTACALWFANGVRRRMLVLRWSAPAVLAILYTGALAISTLNSVDLGEAIKEVIKWLEFAVVLLLVRAMLPRRRSGWLVTGLLVGGALQASIGLYQFVFRIGPEWFMVPGGYMRAGGTFGQPNPFAGYLGLTLPVAASLTIWSWGALGRSMDGAATENTQLRIRRLLSAAGYTGLTLLTGVGLLVSWSRGGWLGALVALGVVTMLRSRASAALGLAGLTVVLGAVLLGTGVPAIVPAPIATRAAEIPAFFGAVDVIHEPVTDENFAVIERVAHWVAALRMWEQAPWFGVGPGNYAVRYDEVRLPRWEEALGHAHNIYLNVLAESGLVGLTAFLALWIGAAIQTLRYCHTLPRTSWERAVALGILGVLLHLTVHNSVDNLFVQGITLHLGMWLGVLSAFDAEQMPQLRSTGVIS